ncbi:MAG: DUF1579 family protein [Phycisphaerales bacterium]
MKTPTTILAILGASALAFLAGRASIATLAPADSGPTTGLAARPAAGPAIRTAAFQPEDGAGVPPEMQAMFEAGLPAEQHEVLARFEGDWNADMVMFTPDGGQLRSGATLRGVRMFDGRFMGQEMSGEFMGRPFEGFALYAYSRPTGEYQAIWFDSMSTHIFMSVGQYDPEKDMLVLHGQEPDAEGAVRAYRDEIEFTSDDEHVFTRYYALPDGEFRGFQVTYTRE